MKKYSNTDNIFFNNMNDLSRSAYSNNTRNDIPLKNNTFDRFETDLMVTHKEEFETNNSRINSLNEEISELKRKLKTVYEKDEEIYKQQCDIKQLQSKCQQNESLSQEVTQLKHKLDQCKNDNDKLRLELLTNESLQTENKLLKQKLLSLVNDTGSTVNINVDDPNVEPINVESINVESVESINVDRIPINIDKFKSILYNRLKSYHEQHIDNLIQQYDLQMKDSIDKETMERILLEAIHI